MKAIILCSTIVFGLAGITLPTLAQTTSNQPPPGTAADLPDKLSTDASWQLMQQGRNVSAEQLSALEAKLRQNPKDLVTRLQLLGREKHGEAMPPAGVKLLLGIIENNPRSLIAGPICGAISAFDQRTYKQAIDLWQNLIKGNPDDPRILGNAATWMEQFAMVQPEYHGQSKVLFEKARALETQNPVWAEHLGQAWIYDASLKSPDQSEQRVAAARKGIEQFEAAYRLRGEPSRAAYRLLNGQSYLAVLADASLLAGETNKAKECAIELLKAADEKKDAWNFGNLIYHYNSFLGLIALREGNPGEAVTYLLAAGKTPGSPQLDSFGPDFGLARELLRLGRPEDRTTVAKFLDEVARFWANPEKESYSVYKEAKVTNRQQIETWKTDIAAGKIPNDRQWQMGSMPKNAPHTALTGGPFTNSLGMKFVPVPGTKVLFCVWLTRVRDFEQFANDSGHNPQDGFSLAKDGWKNRGNSWKNPGFAQTGDHPVSLVSFDDANKFCDWLTRKELGSGKLEAGQKYRLPTDAEWSQAVGPAKYPWGVDSPPPSGAGNYAGEEAKDADWPDNFPVIQGYNDGFARTSPVGSFKANSFGLFDMGGNLREWCDDWYRKDLNSEETRKNFPVLDHDEGGMKLRVLRGASWDGSGSASLASSFRGFGGPGFRYASDGFRCVVVRSSSP